MTKNEFLTKLGTALNGLNEDEKKEIMYDYEEHFRIGMENQKSEDEIAAALGDVREIAKQFKMDSKIKIAETNASAGNIFRAVLATVGMGFFNIVFILGPFLGIVGVMIGLFAGAIIFVIAGVGVFLASILSPVIPSLAYTDINIVFAMFLSIGVTCFGLLFFIGDCYLTKFLYKATIKYLKWNIDIIKK